ncbi:peptidoglycan/xylan/chitin deacetylase (PgdA/CDA1 family) [Bacillus sp. SORGH_AS 510]|uniref:polysaccharide deacetylase family protein n=1 Tax=Bacillus sp. SORGH_AS_0510 TaxID=3041771 RepID=UPI0027805157|nr:polysaccharide deacetylase family protein [Bacillus sp. SORGH_AS_0510]MDQ1145535.1 peptidoglycan/xylan/chitin deacetylase (PgdA/CDA1 family) [Bacillus sp. SORGH_AS_0510]
MKKLLIVFLYFFLFCDKEIGFAKIRVPILVYHSIANYNGQGSKELYVTPENFEKQTAFLRDHGFTLLTFERWQDIKHVPKPIFITFDDGYKNNLNALSIFERLKTDKFKPTGTVFVISGFIDRPNRLSKSDLKMMAGSGLFSIQSHTVTHPDLTKVENVSSELKNSKEDIQKITGKPVIALSYPYGNTNDKVISEAKKYYRYALTTTPEAYSPSGIQNELYVLPRIYIKYSTTLDEFDHLVK